MKKTLIFLVGIITTSCGLVSKYQSAQHAVYAKMLIPADKEQINQSGEITRVIELGNPAEKTLLKGTLRILNTQNPEIFNFVEIGQWVDHGRLGNSGMERNLEFKDTTVNDNLGNSMSRVVYYKEKPSEFLLGERWTSKRDSTSLIRHIEIFKGEILTSEYDVKIADCNIPKSDRQKKGVIIGTRRDYSSSGQLISTKTYDENGKLIKEERYGRQ